MLPPPPPALRLWLRLEPGCRRAAAGVVSLGEPAATVVAGEGVGPGVDGVVACVDPTTPKSSVSKRESLSPATVGRHAGQDHEY